MKKIFKILLVCVCVLVVLYIINPYKIETICFGDVCPANGGTYLFYKKAYTKEECLNMAGVPIVGFGWSEVYAGCSPNNSLSKFVDKLFN